MLLRRANFKELTPPYLTYIAVSLRVRIQLLASQTINRKCLRPSVPSVVDSRLGRLSYSSNEPAARTGFVFNTHHSKKNSTVVTTRSTLISGERETRAGLLSSRSASRS